MRSKLHGCNFRKLKIMITKTKLATILSYSTIYEISKKGKKKKKTKTKTKHNRIRIYTYAKWFCVIYFGMSLTMKRANNKHTEL